MYRIISAVLLHLAIASLVYSPYLTPVVSGSQEFSDGVSNILSFVQDTIGHIQKYVGEQNGCRYTCPNGANPRPRKHYQPSSNGCGSFGFQLEKYISVRVLTKCCNEHDRCYDTCNMAKQVCDSEFKGCLAKLCKAVKKVVTTDVYDACVSAADIMYAGTVALGCKPYKDAQEKACTCGSESSQKMRMEL